MTTVELAQKNLELAIAQVVEFVKTYGHFLLVLEGAVRDLFYGSITEGDFVDQLADLVQEQLTRAWNEGMRANGLDPRTDMEPEWGQVLQDMIANEYNYVDQFAADIVQGAVEGRDISEFLNRARLWANRYNDTVNTAILTTAEEKLVWHVGGTREHCTTCEALDGIVAFRHIWVEQNVQPQSPPNPALECEGWQCQCTLTPTKERQTYGAAKRIAAAVNMG